MTQSVRRFVGDCSFADPSQALDRVILRGRKELVAEYTYEGTRYTATLQSKDGRLFAGAWTSEDGGRDTCEGRLLWDVDGAVFIGTWREGGYEVPWWLALEPVDAFEEV